MWQFIVSNETRCQISTLPKQVAEQLAVEVYAKNTQYIGQAPLFALDIIFINVNVLRGASRTPTS